MKHGAQKSDPLILPMNPANKAGRPAAESVEGSGGIERNAELQSMVRTQSREAVSQAQARIREAVTRNRGENLTALLHHVTIDCLRWAFLQLKKDAAPGVDGTTWEDYAEGLESKLEDLHRRIHTGAYRAQPSRRKYIPKPDGRQRPLGIAALEDKIVQQAVVTILTPIYEAEFLGFSYGFRPGRSQHDALDALAFGIKAKKICWILDTDIARFFDTISHEWLIRFVEHRIGDKRIIRLIIKWLKAGVLEEGQRIETAEGTPQGAVISPLLANIYLHYAYDLWVNQWRGRHARGDMIVVRFADDSAPRRRTGGRKPAVQPCCTRDGGRPPEAAVQAEASNRPLLLPSREVVVRELGKGRARPGQVRTVESNASEPLMRCRKRRDDVKTEGVSLPREECGGHLFTARTASGIEAARTRSRLLCGTWEPVTPMLRESRKGKPPKRVSTDAGYRDGATCSSEEGPVMGLERRGCPIRPEMGRQPAMGGPR